MRSVVSWSDREVDTSLADLTISRGLAFQVLTGQTSRMCWETCAPRQGRPPTPRGKAIARLVLFIVLATTLATASGQAEINRDEYADADVSLIVPEGWVLAEQKSYPNLLVVAVRRGQPGRMNLVAAKVKPGVTARSFCAQSRRTLDQLGFKTARPVAHPSGAYILTGTAPKEKNEMRQAYRLHRGKIYVLTMAAPAAFMPSYERGFDDAVRSLRFKTSPNPAADAGPTPDANVP